MAGPSQGWKPARELLRDGQREGVEGAAKVHRQVQATAEETGRRPTAQLVRKVSRTLGFGARPVEPAGDDDVQAPDPDAGRRVLETLEQDRDELRAIYNRLGMSVRWRWRRTRAVRTPCCGTTGGKRKGATDRTESDRPRQAHHVAGVRSVRLPGGRRPVQPRPLRRPPPLLRRRHRRHGGPPRRVRVGGAVRRRSPAASHNPGRVPRVGRIGGLRRAHRAHAGDAHLAHVPGADRRPPGLHHDGAVGEPAQADPRLGGGHPVRDHQRRGLRLGMVLVADRGRRRLWCLHPPRTGLDGCHPLRAAPLRRPRRRRGGGPRDVRPRAQEDGQAARLDA